MHNHLNARVSYIVTVFPKLIIISYIYVPSWNCPLTYLKGRVERVE